MNSSLNTSLVRITVALTAAAQPSSVPAGSSLRPSRIVGSCSPMRTNSSALRRNMRISHTALPVRRIDAVEISGAFQPSTMPVVTAASTPESRSASAGR